MPASPLEPATHDIARLGREAFERHVRMRIQPEDEGKFVAVDVDTGEY